KYAGANCDNSSSIAASLQPFLDQCINPPLSTCLANSTTCWPIHGSSSTKQAAIASILGMSEIVCSCNCVTAWMSEMTNPTINPAAKTGAAITKATTSMCRRSSVAESRVICAPFRECRCCTAEAPDPSGDLRDKTSDQPRGNQAPTVHQNEHQQFERQRHQRRRHHHHAGADQ